MEVATHPASLPNRSKVSGLIYILDEPSLGLHRQDVQYLQQVIQELKKIGNTIVLVEHEGGLISQADLSGGAWTRRRRTWRKHNISRHLCPIAKGS